MMADGADVAIATQGSAWTEYVSGVTRLEGRPADSPEEEPNFCVLQPGAKPRFRTVHSNWKLEVEQLIDDLGYAVAESANDSGQALRQLADREPRLIWISSDMPFALVDLVQQAFPGAVLTPFPESAWRIRCQKSEYEIGRLRRAAELTADVHRKVARALPRRFTRWELLEAYRHMFMAAGAGALAVPVNVHVLQESGIFAWGRPLDRAGTDVIEPPALMSVDAGARLGGYCADLGRTLVLGELPKSWSEPYSVARAAQSAALRTIRPGVQASAVDEAARQRVEAGGLSTPSGSRRATGSGWKCTSVLSWLPRAPPPSKPG
jgi:Xaa-Pro aminopeptidase